MIKHLAITWVAATALVLGGCTEPNDNGTTPEPGFTPQAQARTFIGTVTQTMDAGGYTYVNVSNGEKDIWAAAPVFPVTVGEEVSVPEGMPMANFKSPSLGRSFELVYFCAAITRPGDEPAKAEAQLPPGHPSVAGTSDPAPPVQLPSGHPTVTEQPEAPVSVGSVPKAAGGKTVAEVFAEKMVLGGQEITVRGTVVKYNANILGKNWVHIQDGTGAKGTNDLTITSDTPVKVGDVVLVKGSLALDKDFGAGYVYDVILENAAITVEAPPQQ